MNVDVNREFSYGRLSDSLDFQVDVLIAKKSAKAIVCLLLDLVILYLFGSQENIDFLETLYFWYLRAFLSSL